MFSSQLFADAEILEDIDQNVLAGDFSDYAAEAVDSFADVLRSEVCREAGCKSFADTEKGSAGIGESLGVALICYQSGVAIS